MTDAKQYPLFGQTLVALITAKTRKQDVVPWIMSHGGEDDRRRAYAWIKGELSGNRTLTEETLSIMLCHLMRLGHVHTLEEIWALLNRGPERYWHIMERLSCLEQPADFPCKDSKKGKDSDKGGDSEKEKACCEQEPLRTMRWLLQRNVPVFPEKIVPPYGIGRPAVLSGFQAALRRGSTEGLPVILSGPQASGVTTLLRQAAACLRIRLWEGLTGERAARLQCGAWSEERMPFFAQTIYWRDRPEWDNATWLARLLDHQNPEGIGLGQIPPDTLAKLPVLLLIDDLAEGRPLRALQERLGAGATIVAGCHGASADMDSVGVKVPLLSEEETLHLIDRYWAVRKKPAAEALPQTLKKQIHWVSTGNPGMVLELLCITRQMPLARMAGYLQGVQANASRAQGGGPDAEKRAVALMQRLLGALTPQQRQALRQLVTLPYFRGYGVWEAAHLWEMDEGSAHLLVGEMVQQGFGVSLPGGLAGDWRLSPVMYRWLRLAFGIPANPTKEKALLQAWVRRVMADPAAGNHWEMLARGLPASVAESRTAYMKGLLRLLKRVFRSGDFLRYGEVYAAQIWRALPPFRLTTGEYLLGEHLFGQAERISQQMQVRVLTGITLTVLFLLAEVGRHLWPGALLDRIDNGLFALIMIVWVPWATWKVIRHHHLLRKADRLLIRVEQRWQHGDAFAFPSEPARSPENRG